VHGIAIHRLSAQILQIMRLGATKLQDIFRKPLPNVPCKAAVREEIGVHKTHNKTLITPQSVASCDDDEPIFSTTHGYSEIPVEREPALYWGLGPVGIRMRYCSPFNFVSTGCNVEASSSQKRVQQQQDNGRDEQSSRLAITPQRPATTLPTPSSSLRSSATVAVGSRSEKRPPQMSADQAPEEPIPDLLPKRGCLRRPGGARRQVKKGITWSRGFVTERNSITPYRGPQDAPDLWYVNGCDIECNICEQKCTPATLRGEPGQARSAQWQIICVDCLSKERLAEIGGLQILSFSAEDGGRSHRGYMRRMLQAMQKVSPLPTGQDTLLHLLRVLQNQGIGVEGCSEDADEMEMRQTALERAVYALIEEEHENIEEEKDLATKRRPAADSASSGKGPPRIATKTRQTVARSQSQQTMRRARITAKVQHGVQKVKKRCQKVKTRGTMKISRRAIGKRPTTKEKTGLQASQRRKK